MSSRLTLHFDSLSLNRTARCKSCGFLEEIDTTQSSSTNPPQQLADLESETTHVCRLCQNFHQHKQEIAEHHSPILQFPPEITSQIFVGYLADNLWDDALGFASPLLLGRICHSWRELAWSTPILWSSIQLDLTLTMDPVLVDQWLVRTNRLPLSIYASQKGRAETFNIPLAQTVLLAITRHSMQWSHITFNLPTFCYMIMAGGLQSRALPSLKYLSLDKLISYGLKSGLKMFKFAPQLRVVRLDGFPLDAFEIPTTQLTQLVLKSPYLHRYLDVLRNCPRVVDCTLHFEAVDPLHGVPTLPDLHIGQLESLNLGAPRKDLIAAIFNCLTIPSARNLSCCTLGRRVDFPHANFISLISRSYCSLFTLSLAGFRVSDRDIIECLQVVPSLQKLTFRDLNITNKTFQMLVLRHQLNLLPNLEVFEYFGDLQFDFVLLESLLRSRWELNETILADDEPRYLSRLVCGNFYTTNAGVPEPHLLSKLGDLAREGMKLTVVTADGEWP